MIVLAGDIGGTKTLLRICNIYKDSSEIILEKTYPSNDYADFYKLLDVFLSSTDIPSSHPVRACFAVAGPIVNGSSKITNLPWIIDESTLTDKFNFAFSKIVNDFTAIGYGLSQLNSKDITTLQLGQSNIRGTKTIIGAGTGLGMCTVVPNNGEPIVLPSEIGNTDFAPSDDFSFELSAHILEHKKRIMYEDILSGGGLEYIYTFLQHKSKKSDITPIDPDTNADLAAYIGQAGLTGEDPVAAQALDYFIKIYAATASNIALITFSVGGLYIAGGIAPKIVTKLATPTFTNTFLANTKMHHILKNIPVYTILNPKVGLLGAIEIAKHAYN